MSKIREALEEVVSILSTWTDHLPPVVQDEAQEAIDKAEAALSEPLKNYEVGTPEEQVKRYRKFCGTYNRCEYCPIKKDGGILSAMCFARWAQMQYKKEGEE